METIHKNTFAPSKKDIALIGNRVDQDENGHAFFIVKMEYYNETRISLFTVLSLFKYQVQWIQELDSTQTGKDSFKSMGFSTDLPYSEYLEYKIASEGKQ